MKIYWMLSFVICLFFSCNEKKPDKNLIYELYISDIYNRIDEVFYQAKYIYQYKIESTDCLTKKRENEFLLVKLEEIYEFGMKTDKLFLKVDARDDAMKCLETFTITLGGLMNDDEIGEVKSLFYQDSINTSVQYRILFLRFFLECIIAITHKIGTGPVAVSVSE